MYARYMVWDAIKFALKRLIGFWLSVIPRMIITFIFTGIVSAMVVGGLYYLIKMLHLIPLGWEEFMFISAVVLATIPPFLTISIVVLRVALGKANGQPVPLWVTPIVRPAIFIFFSSLFAALLSLLGTVALIIPGIFIGIRLFFAKFCIIDHGHGPLKSLKCSWALTRGAKSDIWKLSFILFVFILLIIAVWYWMGMPKYNYTVQEAVDIASNIRTVRFNWSLFAYTLTNTILASLGVLFAAYLYVKLSQKEV